VARGGRFSVGSVGLGPEFYQYTTQKRVTAGKASISIAVSSVASSSLSFFSSRQLTIRAPTPAYGASHGTAAPSRGQQAVFLVQAAASLAPPRVAKAPVGRSADDPPGRTGRPPLQPLSGATGGHRFKMGTGPSSNDHRPASAPLRGRQAKRPCEFLSRQAHGAADPLSAASANLHAQMARGHWGLDSSESTMPAKPGPSRREVIRHGPALSARRFSCHLCVRPGALMARPTARGPFVPFTTRNRWRRGRPPSPASAAILARSSGKREADAAGSAGSRMCFGVLHGGVVAAAPRSTPGELHRRMAGVK